MPRDIEALFDEGVFKPVESVSMEPGTRVRIEIKEVRTEQQPVDLSDVEKSYAHIDEKYPTAKVRLAYRTRDELHEH
jgi:predicted DNA-binding antitoxin AbrB/MazE fold protein